MVKLFVGNLNPQSKASDLRKKFEAFGKVTECDVVNNYGFVHMEKEADAEAALAGLQSCILDGVRINVERSHGKRGSGSGPMRRRAEGRFRDYPDRLRGPPPRYMGGPPPPRSGGRYSGGWDDGYGSPYGPPPRSGGRNYDYPVNGTPSRYMERGEPVRPPPRSATREPLPPPPQSYRGPPSGEGMMPSRDYPPKGAPPRSNYDYDRYRDPAPPAASRQNDYYDNYGSYGSGAPYDDYRDGDRLPPANYDSGYDYNYYDYGSDNRSPAPPRYNYGRP